MIQLRNSSEVSSSSSSLANAGPNGEELIMPGMEFMMECYEDELKRPIRNLVSGQLARSLLIQVQATLQTACQFVSGNVRMRVVRSNITPHIESVNH